MAILVTPPLEKDILDELSNISLISHLLNIDKERAALLLTHFGGIDTLLSTNKSEFLKISGLSEDHYVLLAATYELTQRLSYEI